MDPLSIAAAVGQGAKLAWSTGKALYDLIEDTKLVDESIKALASEATQLGNTCDSVSKHLKNLSGLSVDAEDAQLFSSIQMQLSECDRSLRKLTGAIESVRERRSNFLKQVARQVELNLKQETIAESRTQIRAHTANLQISLQLVNLKATFLAPRLANEELLKQMSQLQTTIMDQGQRIDTTLLQCAKGYLSSGSTLYEESIAGGTVVGLTATQKHDPHIAEWISSLNALRIGSADLHDVQRAPAIPDDFSSEPDTRSGADGSSLRQGASSHSDPYPDDEHEGADSETDEFALELAIAAKENGEIAFERLDYAKAELMLKEALNLLQELPLRARRTDDLLSIHRKLAACAFHLHDAATAKSALLTVVEQSPQGNEEALAFCEAAHLLALVYASTDELGPARSTCNNAYRTRRRILGKDHEKCYKSLALLALICERQHEPTRSEIYLSTIPEEHRSRTVDGIEALMKQRFAQDRTDDVARSAPDRNAFSEASASLEQSRGTEAGEPSQVTDESELQSSLAALERASSSHDRSTSVVAGTSISYAGPGASGSTVRSAKNVTKRYSSVQIKVRNATSNSNLPPSGSQMADIAKVTFNSSTDFYEVMDVLAKRFNDRGMQWRHVLKGLEVLEYCLHCGSEPCVIWARKNIYIIKTLREFSYIDDGGRDVGIWSESWTHSPLSLGYTTLILQVVRDAAKALVFLVMDREDLTTKRADLSAGWTSVVSGRKHSPPKPQSPR